MPRDLRPQGDWPPADLMAKIAADYPGEPPAAILAALEKYAGVERARVGRCVLYLAGSNRDELLRLVAAANTDYRDVIHGAEYDRDGKRIRNFDRPFEVTAPAPADGPLSYLGGRPFLARDAGIPTCAVCSAPMCFFFQVALPAGHPWREKILAMFHCVSCCSDGTLIPKMLTVPLKGADLPSGSLARDQTNFRIVVSDVATVSYRGDYDPPIQYSPISPAAWRVGAEPQWLLDDETPGSYESFAEPVFLFQVPGGMAFPRRPGAPPQKTLDLRGHVVDSELPHYELFLGNAIYLFGFGTPASERIVVLTQADSS